MAHWGSFFYLPSRKTSTQYCYNTAAASPSTLRPKAMLSSQRKEPPKSGSQRFQARRVEALDSLEQKWPWTDELKIPTLLQGSFTRDHSKNLQKVGYGSKPKPLAIHLKLNSWNPQTSKHLSPKRPKPAGGFPDLHLGTKASEVRLSFLLKRLWWGLASRFHRVHRGLECFVEGCLRGLSNWFTIKEASLFGFTA